VLAIGNKQDLLPIGKFRGVPYLEGDETLSG